MNIFTSHPKQEKGLASIVITMLLMVVITLTVLGFAQLSRREQRQALDRQLSTQAFYAAETGVNDAVKAIQLALEGGGSVPTYDECGEFGGEGNIGAETGVSYTCVLVDPTPESLEYSDVGADAAIVIPVRPTSGTIDSITLSWGKSGGGSNFACPGGGASAPSLPPAGTWTCDPGVLRVDLVSAASGFSRSNLNSNAFTAFFYPNSGGTSSINFSSANGPMTAGVIQQVPCSGTSSTPCQVTVNVPAGNSFYLHVRSMYRSNTLAITAANSGTNVQLSGSQVAIDSTGKAGDVLRRVNVRVPINEDLGDGVPPFVLQTTRDMCKRFAVYPTGATDEASVAGCSL